jgi:AcrR family transcriptional regulator
MDKKEAILNSALELFTTKGFDNTSTTLITKNAEVGTGTLFLYFKTKVELINELFLSIKKETYDIIKQISEYEMITEDVMKQLWVSLINWGLKNPKKMRFIRQYSSSPYITKLTKDQQEAESELLKSQIQKAIEEGILKEYPITLIIEVTFALNYAVIFYLLRIKNYNDKLIDSFFPLVWDMIKR